MPSCTQSRPSRLSGPSEVKSESSVECAFYVDVPKLCACCLCDTSIVGNNISTDSIQLSETSASFEAPFSTWQLGPGTQVWLAGVRVRPLQRSHDKNRHIIKCCQPKICHARPFMSDLGALCIRSLPSFA